MKVRCFNGTVREGTKVTGTYVDSAGNVQYQYPGVSRINPLGFKATLNDFVADGTAEVLSNPTILVLDGRVHQNRNSNSKRTNHRNEWVCFNYG